MIVFVNYPGYLWGRLQVSLSHLDIWYSHDDTCV
ncbi:uncharacterized protein METZ01_LOCUS502862, partial [marine metagenome]